MHSRRGAWSSPWAVWRTGHNRRPVVFVAGPNGASQCSYSKAVGLARMYGARRRPDAQGQTKPVLSCDLASRADYIPAPDTQLIRSRRKLPAPATPGWDRFVGNNLTHPRHGWYIEIYFGPDIFSRTSRVDTFNPTNVPRDEEVRRLLFPASALEKPTNYLRLRCLSNHPSGPIFWACDSRAAEPVPGGIGNGGACRTCR